MPRGDDVLFNAWPTCTLVTHSTAQEPALHFPKGSHKAAMAASPRVWMRYNAARVIPGLSLFTLSLLVRNCQDLIVGLHCVNTVAR